MSSKKQVDQFEERYKDIPTKYKKGHCYRNAFAFLMRYRKTNSTLVLCHGWVTGTKGVVKGVRYSHAWVEAPKEKYVVDPSLNVDDPIVIWDFIYYKLGNVDTERVLKYSIQEAMETALKRGSYGPWDDKFDE